MDIQQILASLKSRIAASPPKDPKAFHYLSRELYRVIDDGLESPLLANIVRPKLAPIENLLAGVKSEVEADAGAAILLEVITDIENYILQKNSPAFADLVAEALDRVKNDNQAEKEALTLALNNAEKARSDAGKALENVEKELNRLILESQRFADVIQQREVVKNQGDFRTQSKINLKVAVNLSGIIVIILSLFIYYLTSLLNSKNDLFDIARNIYDQSKDLNIELVNRLIYIEIARKIFIRIFIYTLIVYLISFLVKNFTSQMHNYTANANKANALDSMISLVGTTKTAEGNDAILTHVTQAIFASQHTGYQNKKDEPSSPSVVNNVIDAIKPK